MEEKYKKYTNRIRELVQEFDEKIIFLRKSYRNIYGETIYFYSKENSGEISSWLMKVESIISLIFSKNSVQFERFKGFRDALAKGQLKKEQFYAQLKIIRGILEACLDDIEKGFLQNHEFIIANEIFDSVLEEAKFFIFEQKNKNIGAILLRIVLEDAIKRIARKEGLEIENKRVSTLNDELKASNYFIQTIWSQNQAWLSIGNKAAHGNFEEYDLNQVENFYNGLVNFISVHAN